MRRRLLFALLAVAATLAAGEACLRLAGFRWQPVPDQFRLGRLQGGIPTGEVVFDRRVAGLFERDGLLFWKPVAGRAPFNAQGLRDDEDVQSVKPPDEFRILALGDSCTFLGEPAPWPERLEARLQSSGERRVRVLNAAVPAWTSLQGRRYLEARGLDFQPDLVTIYFGWNDHWRATVRPDAEFAVPGRGVVGAQNVLARARLYQALARLILRPPASGGGTGDFAAGRPFRVPEADFDANLRAMAAAARGAGAGCMLITAPSTLTGDHVPAYLSTHGFLDLAGERVESIHARYAAIVRNAAPAAGCGLVDAAADFAAAGPGEPPLLREDGIHLTRAGIERLADLVAAGVRAVRGQGELH